jgi:multiple antibiotic resistance protein
MFDFALTAIASVLFVVDPVGALPAYLAMSEGDDQAKRRRTAWLASLVATLTLAAFAATGNLIFRLFGLTLPVLQIAGGLILFLVALDMIRAQCSTQEGPGEVNEGKAKEDVAITPLAIPMLAGPAGLSTVTTLMGQARNGAEALAVYLAIALTGLISYVTRRLAGPVHAWLGRTGIHVFSRVLGLILAAIAVQFVLDGLRAAGLDDVTETELRVDVVHATFEEWWAPFTSGVGPAGSYVAGLDPDHRERLRERCRELYPDPPFRLTAIAWAARGLVP